MMESIRDKTGQIVNFDSPGYHIPNAEVQFPQVLLSTVGENFKAIQINADQLLCLCNGVELQAHICSCSNLPLLKVCDHASDEHIFAFAAGKNMLDGVNANLSAPEKGIVAMASKFVSCLNFVVTTSHSKQEVAKR